MTATDLTDAALPASTGEERTCRLAPMQLGMLYQSLLADSSGQSTSGDDLEQLHVVLPEALALSDLERAFAHVLRRHPALTASFHWEGVEQPQQRFDPHAELTLEVEDWTALSAAARESRRAEFLCQDRRRGFDLRRAPLMRVTVFPCGGEQTELVWTVHHLVVDGRSIATVIAEVFEAYGALQAGKSPALPGPAPRSFEAYLHWLETHPTAPSLPYFRTLLAGKFAPTPLPLAEPSARPLALDGSGEHIHVLPAAARDAVHVLATQSQTTVGTVVQAAWALVLSRLTGDRDVLYGLTRSTRRTALGGKAEPMVGLLINTFPSRFKVRDTDTVETLLREVRQQTMSLRDHEHTSLAEIHAQSALPHGTPLFETLLMFDNRALHAWLSERDERWRARSCHLHEQPSPPLTVTVFDDAELELRLLYHRRRYRPEVVGRIAGYLSATLEAMSRRPEARLGELDILPAEERRTILYDWNDTAAPFPDTLCIHEPFETRAAEQPEAIAVEQNGVSLTFAELDARANQLAHALIARGARAGTFIGVGLDRTCELVVALLAIAKSGAAYVPLDLSYPPERLAFMLEDTGARLVVTEERHRDRFETPILTVDGEDAVRTKTLPSTRPPRDSRPEDVCYVIFTSGSTGKPKGVVLTHRAVLNTFDWISRSFDVRPEDRLLFVTSPCFDLSVYDTFGALGAGATVVVASTEQLRDAEALAALVVDARITVWDSAPAALQRLVPFFPDHSKESPLRLVMLSGDWIPVTLPDAMRGTFPRVHVQSLGGATEAAIWSNGFPIGAVDPRWTSIPYGKPIQNARYHVLDDRLEPTAIGVPGELYIAGVCLAEGYHRRPELTAERFIPDPFHAEGGSRLYRTGDLARYFDDGNLEFLGRADFQVKVRGFRVELGEIEALLTSHPAVREAVCVAVPDASGQNALCAYLVLREGESADETALKTFVAARLPDFMVPSHVMFLPAMPLSSNGKVDRKALPSPSAASASARQNHVAPRTEAEQKMAAIWREVLRKDTVGIRDDFFALGGHSLLAVNLIVRIKRELGLDVPLSLVLARPTIEGLLASVARPVAGQTGPKHLVTLNGQGSRTPLVLVSGMGGFGFVFQGLARHLGPDQPVHVLNAVGAQDASEGYGHSIEALASIYEPQVLGTCPEGPLVLGGYSFGVLVAFELAHRLRAKGRTVQLLVSFDGFAPGFPELLPTPERLKAHVRHFVRGDALVRRQYVAERLQNIRARAYRLLGRPEASVTPAVADAETDERLRMLAVGLWRARDQYKPPHREALPLLLLKSEEPDIWVGCRYDDPFYGWSRFIDAPIQTFTLPGRHLTLFRSENLPVMAEVISRAVGPSGPST